MRTTKSRIDPWGFDRELMTWWQRNLHWVIPIGAAAIIFIPTVVAHYIFGL